ncbi:MAG: hypothetical protein RLN72_00265 [Henriciella sp.]
MSHKPVLLLLLLTSICGCSGKTAFEVACFHKIEDLLADRSSDFIVHGVQNATILEDEVHGFSLFTATVDYSQNLPSGQQIPLYARCTFQSENGNFRNGDKVELSFEGEELNKWLTGQE